MNKLRNLTRFGAKNCTLLTFKQHFSILSYYFCWIKTKPT